MNQDINAVRKKFDLHFKSIKPAEAFLPDIGKYLRVNWNQMTEMGRATASVSINHYQGIPERNKVRFRNDWARFRTFLSRVPELKRIESHPNDPLHDDLKEIDVALDNARLDDYEAVFEFQDMLMKHINHFESNKTFHVSVEIYFFIYMTDHFFNDRSLNIYFRELM